MADVFSCVLCSKKFPSKAELQEHFRDHATPNGSRKVSVEKKDNSSSSGSREAIACDICGEQFSSNTTAIRHKFRKHPEANDKFHCPSCGMLFTIKAIFERHAEKHRGDQIYDEVECEECGAKFNNNVAKDYHLKSAHKRVMKLYSPVATAPPSKKIKLNNAGDVQSVYYCHICGSEYIVKFNLQKHLEQYHTEAERLAAPSQLIRCTVCDALFYNQKAYESHNVGHKPTDLYVPDEESRLKTVTRIDQDFDYRRVMPLADKYIQGFKKRKASTAKPAKSKQSDDDEELSPPSSPDPSSDSDSGENVPRSVLRPQEGGVTDTTETNQNITV